MLQNLSAFLYYLYMIDSLILYLSNFDEDLLNFPINHYYAYLDNLAQDNLIIID